MEESYHCWAVVYSHDAGHGRSGAIYHDPQNCTCSWEQATPNEAQKHIKTKIFSLSNRNIFSVVVGCETITLNSISIPAKHFCYTLSILLRWYELSWAQYNTDRESELTGMLLALLSRTDLRSMEDCGGTTDGLAVSYPARQCCTNSTHVVMWYSTNHKTG